MADIAKLRRIVLLHVSSSDQLTTMETDISTRFFPPSAFFCGGPFYYEQKEGEAMEDFRKRARIEATRIDGFTEDSKILGLPEFAECVG